MIFRVSTIRGELLDVLNFDDCIVLYKKYWTTKALDIDKKIRTTHWSYKVTYTQLPYLMSPAVLEKSFKPYSHFKVAETAAS